MKNDTKHTNDSLKFVLFIIWTVLSAIFLLLLIFPFLFEEFFILDIVPLCQSVEYGIECSLCGMTRAFIQITKGNISEAISLNKGSIHLFIAMLINTFVYTYFYIRRSKSTYLTL